jgi:hypothetical protein
VASSVFQRNRGTERQKQGNAWFNLVGNGKTTSSELYDVMQAVMMIIIIIIKIILIMIMINSLIIY